MIRADLQHKISVDVAVVAWMRLVTTLRRFFWNASRVETSPVVLGCRVQHWRHGLRAVESGRRARFPPEAAMPARARVRMEPCHATRGTRAASRPSRKRGMPLSLETEDRKRAPEPHFNRAPRPDLAYCRGPARERASLTGPLPPASLAPPQPASSRTPCSPAAQQDAAGAPAASSGSNDVLTSVSRSRAASGSPRPGC